MMAYVYVEDNMSNTGCRYDSRLIDPACESCEKDSDTNYLGVSSKTQA